MSTTFPAVTDLTEQDRIAILLKAIRDVPDFPKPGILFKDIMPLLADANCFQIAVTLFVEHCQKLISETQKIDKIVGIDARGFLFGAAVAYALKVGFVPVRKKGKLPGKTEALNYSLEYGEAAVEMPADSLRAGENIILIDDLLATGGTAAAALHLIERLGARALAMMFLVELQFLKGRDKVPANVPVTSILTF